MFNFMKKGVSVASSNASDREKAEREEKEKRKREKKLRKDGKNPSGVSGSMSTEELLRLDEVRRSLKIRGRRKEKEKLPSGITADYSAEFFAALNADSGSNELDRGNEEIVASVHTTIESRYNGNGTSAAKHSISESITFTGAGGDLTKSRFMLPVPPKPPKRGILKGSRSNISNIHEEITIASPDALIRNTMQNEMLFDGNRSMGGAGSIGSSSSQHGTSFTSVESLRSEEGGIQRAMTLPTNARYTSPHIQSHGNLRILTSPSPSADSLTDTTNSSFATPPFSLSPIGESQGIDRWSRVQHFEDTDLPLPPIKLVKLPPARTLTIRRQKSPRHDFGFSLRKAMCLDRTESLANPVFKPVIFAEPGAGGGSTGLLPGDRLLKVNGTSVCDLSREIIIEMIRNSGDSVTVEVQPVSELVELSRRCMPPKSVHGDDDETDRSLLNADNCNTLKRSASKRIKSRGGNEIQHQNSQEDNVNSVAGHDGGVSDSVWLVHRGGFCAALRLPQTKAHLETHKVVIQLLHNGEEMTVDEDDIEKQNASSLDLVEDICELKHLNEASVLHCLRQRFASNLIHTKAGPTLLVVNPMAPLSLYSEKVVSMFRGCKTEDMPPHIYSLAQTAYRAMLESRRDQSLIFMGRSGSGKTTSFKHALYYLALAAGSVNNFLNAEKVNSINIILEAFGNTKTCLNSNATRLTQLLSLDVDQSGQIASASLQVLLPERQRAGRRLNNEYSFHIMSRLLAGAAGSLQKELHIDGLPPEDNHPFVSVSQKLEDRQRAAADFMRTALAFETLNIDPKAVRGIWGILASIYHLGLAGVTIVGSGPTSRTQFANPSAARKAAVLLGVSFEDLTGAAFNVSTSGSTSPSKAASDNIEQAWECLDALVVGLYSEALAAVVALINKTICTASHTIASIVLVDTPGFQNPASCGSQIGATLSDLKHNYLQERLQLLFHHNTLVAPRDRYAQELVEIDTECISELNPAPLISLIDKAPQNHVVRSSQRDLREQDRRGLLWLLDEESMYPNSNDDTFLERLFSHYGDREHQSILRKCTGPKQFILQHLQGTNPVLYSVNGWVRNSREHPAIRNAGSLLQDSSRDEISRLYIGSLTRSTGGIVFCGSFAGLEGTQSLRRVSSIRRSFTSAGVKRNSIMLQVKFTVDGIIDTLRRTGTHFVHCYLLQHNAGQHSCLSSNGSPNTSAPHNAREDLVNVPLLRSQLRGSQVLDAARLHRLGFPETVPLAEFERRFGLLAGECSKEVIIEQILSSNEIDPATYRIGPSQVVAHDENKLNAVLKTFDKIIFDYNDPLPQVNSSETNNAQDQKTLFASAVNIDNATTAESTLDDPKQITNSVENSNADTHGTAIEKKNEENTMSQTDCRHQFDFQRRGTKLEKSLSSISLTGRKCYQSPDSPCLRQMRHAFAQQQHQQKSKSVWELSNTTKIPILKTIPLQKRSKSFCYQSSTQTKTAPYVDAKESIHTSGEKGNKSTPKPKKMTRCVNYVNTRPPLMLSSRKPNVDSNGHTVKIKQETKIRNKNDAVIITNQHKKSHSNANVSGKSRSSSSAPPTPPRRSRTSDELLDKCLEKGQQILRKVESLNSTPVNKKSVVRVKSSASVKSSKDNLRRKKVQQRLHYANEEKISSPPLESRKIIAPAFAQACSKHAELLVNVVQVANTARSTPQRQISTDSGFANSSNSLEFMKPPLDDVPPVSKLLESDSDDSGHISNENMELTINHHHQPSSSSSSTTSLTEQTAKDVSREQLNRLPQRVCTTCRIAQVDSVQVIRTHVEIFPNFTKEILFRSGVLSELEAKRDELLSDRIIQLQAYCRGYLARRSMAQRRVQELAVRCIQRNVKAFLAVRDWPWWRLLVRVTPLLNVHRTEEQLKSANEELLALKSKLERIENDRNELKTENQKLEAKLSEMAVDLAEERSSGNMATERLEGETAERLRLEKELSEKESKVKKLQENTEKLEMELICAKSDLNGISEEEDLENDEGGSAGGVYKLKYERVAKELEFTKRRLQTQHEHDLEQLIGLKKQLEKKLSDAYEEVEEQRQVVGQWKRKAQKMTNEMNDLRMLLEEQNGRNNLLEKKQRKFDSECQALQDTARQERQAKDRLSREKDILIAEKFTLEQSLADTRLELDLKEEKLASLQRELEEMTFGGGTEEEIAQLRRSKNELDRRVKEQEEELDEMAGQVQLLEQAKLRLEMTLETMRKEARREAQQRDEELEEARGCAYKKIKALECQLETEHEERTLLLREKHELERRLSSMEDQDRVDRQAEEAANQKLRRDLRKYKALLKDAHAQLERLKVDTPGKTLIRQLRNQLEDAESARTLAMKARQTAEADLAEVQAMYEESNRARNEAEEKATAAQRDRGELQAQIEENEEELAELMKKYSATVKQLNTEQIAASEYEFKLSELEAERNSLKEQVTDLQHRLENIENLADPSAAMMSKRLELRSKELESRLDLEQATRARLEVQVNRHKEALERIQNEVTQSKVREMQAQEALKKSQKSLRELREEFHAVSGREQESITKRKDLEKKVEQVESEASALKNDLRLALQRIADLQQAMEEGDDDLSDSEESRTSDGSISDLEERLKPIQTRRQSLQKQNGSTVSTTTTLVREKSESSPRIILTSPSSPHIYKKALLASKSTGDDPKQSALSKDKDYLKVAA